MSEDTMRPRRAGVRTRRALAAMACAAAFATAAVPAAEPAASRPAGPASAAAEPDGAQARQLEIEGQARRYLVQPVAGATRRLPVVLLLHEGGQTAEDAWRATSLPALAAREGFIVVAPQALDKQWNDARGAAISGHLPSTADDVRFLKAVIAEVLARDRGDASAVFMVGAAGGGVMTMRFACDEGEVLRAAASAIATLPEALAQSCNSPRQLPWLSIVGTDDAQVPFAGQPAGLVRHGQAQPALRSAEASFDFWADRAGCAAATTRRTLAEPAAEERGRWAEAFTRAGCVGGLTSAQVVLHGTGHLVPEGGMARPHTPYKPGLDGGTLIWDHFKATLLK